RFIPRKTDLDKFPTRRLSNSIAAYNNTPRKCLDFRTPAEAFAAQVLHFECESTGPITTGRCCWSKLGPQPSQNYLLWLWVLDRARYARLSGTTALLVFT